MRVQPRLFMPSWLPIMAGLAWLACGWRAGLAPGLFASLPGSLLLAPGVALLLWPGDRQISHYLALGGLVSVPLAVPMFFAVNAAVGSGLVLLGLLSYLVAGYAALHQSSGTPGVPEARVNRRMATKVALDEAVLAYFVGTAQVPTNERVAEDVHELESLCNAAAANGWLERPEDLHAEPPPPDDAVVRVRRGGGEVFQHLQFTSGYRPHPDLPGSERWLRYGANRRIHAWMFRHTDGPRPWLMCIHGYRMGMPWVDFTLFSAQWLHRRLGMNLIMPILPLHGPRRGYSRSGSGFLDGHISDIFQAEVQAAWDMRRILAWLRQQEDSPAVGALGYSLGGYNAALLASLDSDLACAIAGIPLTDMADIIWHHLPLLHLRYIESCGLQPARARQALAPISPLALEPKTTPDRRFVFAAAGDQLVPPQHAARLIEHWGNPGAYWYQGSHLSVRRERSVRAFLEEAFASGGLLPPEAVDSGCSRLAEAGK